VAGVVIVVVVVAKKRPYNQQLIQIWAHCGCCGGGIISVKPAQTASFPIRPAIRLSLPREHFGTAPVQSPLLQKLRLHIP
jgi:hypothetical protein